MVPSPYPSLSVCRVILTLCGNEEGGLAHFEVSFSSKSVTEYVRKDRYTFSSLLSVRDLKLEATLSCTTKFDRSGLPIPRSDDRFNGFGIGYTNLIAKRLPVTQ